MNFFSVLLQKIWEEIYAFRKAYYLCLMLFFVEISCIFFHQEIPYINFLLCFSSFLFVLLVVVSVKSVRLQYRLFWMILTAIISMGCWIIFSYQSYYQGVRVTKSTEAQILYHSANVILTTDLPEEHKIKLLNDITSKTKASILIQKNGADFYFQPHGRNTNQYIIERISDEDRQKEIYHTQSPEWDTDKYIPFAPMDYNGNHYEFFYEYANKPYLLIGLERAITWSVFPDILNSDNGFQHFIAKRFYERSMNFWVPYLLLFVCGILVSFSTTKLTESEEKLKRVNKQLSESNNKLAIWRNTYEKIQRDFSGVVSNSKNNLQHMQSEWDKDFKAAAGLGRHDVLNRIKLLRNDVSLLSNEQVDVQRKERLALFKQALIIGAENESTILKDNYDFVLSPWIDKMHVELKGLESTLDIVVTDVSIIEVLKAIQAGIPPDILQKKTSVDFLQNISENVDRNKKCRVILNKIKSIVFNLISNSAAATESRIDTFIENGDRDKIVAYVREIQLHIYEKIHMDKRCLCIEVNDNGGGFPEDILYKIYKEPIRTTKDNREYGQGTSYIGFFVDLMGADIEAKNINFENGERGASTLVYIPYLPE